jgi:hypothetical protein
MGLSSVADMDARMHPRLHNIGESPVKNRILALGLLAGVGLYLLAGCSADRGMSTGTALGHVSIRLTDAPGDYDEVNLVVDAVSIHRDGPDSTSGWEALKHDSTTTYDLLKLRNGVFAMLAVGDVPAGHYTQVRLHLGAGSNVVVGGVTYPLKVPSGMQSGYKLVGEFDVPPGGLVEMTLDFDASRSIVHTGSGKYMLKPTCRVIVSPLETGDITGHLLPEGVAASAFALADTDTVASTSAGLDGRFKLVQLAPGTYSVAIHPDTSYRDTTIAGVGVQMGHITDLGDIQLTPKVTQNP